MAGLGTKGKRRALGQHFLRDEILCDLIVDTFIEHAQATNCASLLEIGPGKGALTFPLLHRIEKNPIPFVLCETDRVLAQEWKERVAPLPHCTVQEADFLVLPEELWLNKSPLAVVSNLPYSSGTAILSRLASHTQEIPVMVLMFQAEVAERLRAIPSTKAWGSLSVWIQNNWDLTKLHRVPPGAFSPPPEVFSEVVLLQRRKTPRIAVGTESKDKALWQSLLKAAFAHRRKMLRSGLPHTLPFQNALKISGVDGAKRAEALEWGEWESLFRALLSTTAGGTDSV
ncbi:16S rRNA (adenine(1518)-N(6)/adenine(1519)-N(6))-dimethyltransferase RsmA [Bdellovibrionota bacterium FG-2]